MSSKIVYKKGRIVIKKTDSFKTIFFICPAYSHVANMVKWARKLTRRSRQRVRKNIRDDYQKKNFLIKYLLFLHDMDR